MTENKQLEKKPTKRPKNHQVTNRLPRNSEVQTGKSVKQLKAVLKNKVGGNKHVK